MRFLFSASMALLAIAVDTVQAGSTTKRCMTTFGSNALKGVRTTTHTERVTRTYTCTSIKHPTVTFTPALRTATVNSTTMKVMTTTNPTITDTSTSTQSVMTTTTTTLDPVTSTVTTTSVSSTTVTSTSTSTFGLLSRATPILSTLPGSSEQAVKKQKKKREAYMSRMEARMALSSNLGSSEARDPINVDCTVHATVTVHVTVTKTGTAVTKTATALTTTTTAVVTLTSTSTVYPGTVKTTVTETDTSTVTTTQTPLAITTTKSTTTTATVQVQATVTSYALCSDDNFANDSVNGTLSGGSTHNNAGYSQAGTTTATAADCCAICARSPNCGVSGWSGGYCFVGYYTICTMPSQYSWFAILGKGSVQSAFQFSNGYCGAFDHYEAPP